jgi:hypothetical protein
MAGQLMLANENSGFALNDRLGSRETFLGAGRSETAGGTDYKDASVTEYLVPNLSDHSLNVWVWTPQQAPGQKPIMEQKLLDVLQTPQANTTDKHPAFDRVGRN